MPVAPTVAGALLASAEKPHHWCGEGFDENVARLFDAAFVFLFDRVVSGRAEALEEIAHVRIGEHARTVPAFFGPVGVSEGEAKSVRVQGLFGHCTGNPAMPPSGDALVTDAAGEGLAIVGFGV